MLTHSRGKSPLSNFNLKRQKGEKKHDSGVGPLGIWTVLVIFSIPKQTIERERERESFKRQGEEQRLLVAARTWKSRWTRFLLHWAPPKELSDSGENYSMNQVFKHKHLISCTSIKLLSVHLKINIWIILDASEYFISSVTTRPANNNNLLGQTTGPKCLISVIITSVYPYLDPDVLVRFKSYYKYRSELTFDVRF